MDKKKLRVIKIGGNVIDDENALQQFLKDFAAVEGLKILVHGGGKIASELSKKLDVEPQLVDGRRITDEETLKVVTMVYAGLINKNIVAQLQSYGCKTLGFTGADGNLVLAHKRHHPSIDFGFVGDIDEVNSELMADLLEKNYCFVIAPITHDGEGNLLNTNADTIASAVAKELGKTYEVDLVYCFEKRGLLADPENEESVIPLISKAKAEELINQQLISAGMIPKVHNIFDALEKGVEKVILCHAKDLHSVLKENSIFGTTFVLNED